MDSLTIVPDDFRSAGRRIRVATKRPLHSLSHKEFVSVWSSFAYLFPSLHPDEYDNDDGCWPQSLRRFAIEAWARADRGELSDEELYPSDAQWAGINDRFEEPMEDCQVRRWWLRVKFGDLAYSFGNRRWTD
jgi:hypothetical protein